MGKYELLLRSTFSAAHRLKTRDGAYEPLHEHHWQVEVFLEGTKLDDAGLVADFTDLHRSLSEIIGDLNGAVLNKLPAFSGHNPSTELIAKHLHDRFAPELPPNVRVTKMRVWETGECAAAYIPAPSDTDTPIGPDASGIG